MTRTEDESKPASGPITDPCMIGRHALCNGTYKSIHANLSCGCECHCTEPSLCSHCGHPYTNHAGFGPECNATPDCRCACHPWSMLGIHYYCNLCRKDHSADRTCRV